MIDIKIFANGGYGFGPFVQGVDGNCFFDILLYIRLLYFFIYVIIKTYIRSFIVVLVIYFTHS